MKTFAVHGLAAVFLAVFCWTAFSGVQYAEFVELDDSSFIVHNPHIRHDFSKESLTWALGAGLWIPSPYAEEWTPLAVLSKMLDYRIFGMDARGFHITNSMLHVMNAFLVYLLGFALSGGNAFSRSAKALLWATLFAAHPLVVETVAWVSERKGLLSALFGLMALNLYVRGRSVAVVVCFVLSLLAKPMLVMLPVIFILVDWMRGKETQDRLVPETSLRGCSSIECRQPRRMVSSGWVYQVLLFSISGVFCATTVMALKDVHLLSVGWDYFFRGLFQVPIYVGKIFFPHGLAIYSSLLPHEMPLHQVALSGALIVMVSWLVVRFKRYPYLVVGWFWFLIGLIPVIWLKTPADRYMYFPLMGILMAVVWGAWDWGRRSRAAHVTVCILFCAASIGFVHLSKYQVSHWRNSQSLFEHALHVDSDNALIHMNLGFVMSGKGDDERALHHYHRALRIAPGYQKAHNNLGTLYYKQGKLEDAIRHFSIAIALDSGFNEARNNLKIAQIRQKVEGS